MHGTVAGNWAVCDCDFLLCLGARFDDRITGKIEKFATEAKIAHIDIDISEHNKNKIVDLPIHSDIKYAIRRLIELWKKNKCQKPDISEWNSLIQKWKAEHPFLMKLQSISLSKKLSKPYTRKLKAMPLFQRA